MGGNTFLWDGEITSAGSDTEIRTAGKGISLLLDRSFPHGKRAWKYLSKRKSRRDDRTGSWMRKNGAAVSMFISSTPSAWIV